MASDVSWFWKRSVKRFSLFIYGCAVGISRAPRLAGSLPRFPGGRRRRNLVSVEFLISDDCLRVPLKNGVGVILVEVPLDPVDRVAEYRWPAVDAVHIRAEEVGFLVSERLLNELRLPVEESGQAFM